MLRTAVCVLSIVATSASIGCARAVATPRGADPTAIEVDGEPAYVNAAGVVVPVLRFDNGPDYFVEGLARTVQNGKVGFVDESLRVVIAPAWDFAFPFENGAALVCEGCTRRRVGDEHEEVVGGRWGRIDARGRVVVPVIHARDAVPAAAPR